MTTGFGDDDLRLCLRRLQRQNRGTRGIAILAITLLLGSWLAGAASVQTEVTAKRFVVVDDEGKTRGLFAMQGNTPGLALHDEKGTPRGVFGFTEGGVGVGLFDEKGRLRGSLAFNNGIPGLVLRDETDNVRVVLHAKRELPTLMLYGQDGKKSRASLGVSQQGTSLLSLADEDGMTGVHLGAAKMGSGLILKDNDGTQRGSLHTWCDTTSLVLHSTQKEKGYVQLGATPSESGLVLAGEARKKLGSFLATDDGTRLEIFDQQEKTVFSAPASKD